MTVIAGSCNDRHCILRLIPTTQETVYAFTATLLVIMNTRDYKPFAADNYYHIYNRGNDKQDIFLEKDDYFFFLSRLRESLYPKTDSHYRRKSLPENAYTLLAYVLMPNHFHFLLKQNTELEVSKLISKVCTSYSKYFNKKYKKTGGLFQPKFRAILVKDENYLLFLSAYIHTNPSVASITRDNKDYPWSSYPDYVCDLKGTLPNKKVILGQFSNSVSEYARYVSSCQSIIADKKYLKGLRLDETEIQ